ncbi:MAG: xanthine dehydrogenase family protein molybdopterin-binding subunit [Dehalococcoidia bacterium]|nr:xanthine dehydrogenase family protein molybdopterin-binding subunit [Dehalococcoidia bacterium]
MRVVATEPAKGFKVVGSRPVRPDGVDKVNGRAIYGADVRFPRMLFGRVLRSPHAHAIVHRIDTSKAEALPGVTAVVTNADFPRQSDQELQVGEGEAASARWILDNVLASEKVLYRGHAVAAVAATDPHIAEDALDLIEVEYEVLEPVIDVQRAMLESAPLLHDSIVTEQVFGFFGMDGSEQAGRRPSNVSKKVEFTGGDLDAGFAAADVVLEREFDTPMYHQGYIEPQNGTALWSEDDTINVWTSTQAYFGVRDQLAVLLKHPVSKIRVNPAEIGGGFGGKSSVYMEPLAALLSKRSDHRPVKMSMTRQEVFEATGPTPGAHMRVKIGAKRDGTITAIDWEGIYESGAYPASAFTAGAMAAWGPYDIKNFRSTAWEVVNNKPRVQAYRAPAAPAAAWSVESMVDEVARAIDLDPVELRLKNAMKEGGRRIDGAPHGPIGNVACLEAVRDSPHYRSELSGEHRGRGIAAGFWFNIGGESGAFASIHPDGTVALNIGSADIGGSRASLSMQFAEAMGIAYEQVKPQTVNTDSIGYTLPTVGSRTTFAGGWAVYETAQALRRKLEERAASIWECDRSAVHYDDDAVVRGPGERSFTFNELAAQLQATGGLIQAEVDVAPTTSGPAFAAHVVDVEVDPDTGKVQVLRYTAVQDVGRAIHPDYVEGQIQGGAAQGVGMALTEEYVFGEDGRMQNSTLLDYRMPTALDLPMIDIVMVEVPNPGHPYGVRGVGEVPIVPPLAAVTNAIRDAIGVRATRLPASPDRLLDLIEEQRRQP